MPLQDQPNKATKQNEGMKRENYEPLIRRALSDFDFIKVHRVMELLNWTWFFSSGSRVPSIGELYQKAEMLLRASAKDMDAYYSGGFHASVDEYSVSLRFVLADSWIDDSMVEDEDKEWVI